MRIAILLFSLSATLLVAAAPRGYGSVSHLSGCIVGNLGRERRTMRR
jgi:hypothetical protein